MQAEREIRPLTTKDKDQYLDLFSKLLSIDFPEYSKKIKEYVFNEQKKLYKERIQSPQEFLYGAFQGETLTGIIEGGLLGGGVSYCSWLLVHPDFQHQGIGKSLLHTCEEQLIEKGIHSLHLYSAKWNNPYYEKMGFELVGLYKNAWYGSSDYFFIKTIQEPKEENFLK